MMHETEIEVRPCSRENSLLGLFRRAVRHMARAHHREHHRDHHGRHAQYPRSRGVHDGHGGHAQMRILAILGQKESMSQRELMELLAVRSASLSELLAKLEHNGFIVREKDEQDKRSFMLRLTEEGRVVASNLHQQLQEREDAFFVCLSNEEREQLAALLGKLVQSLEAKEEDEGPDGHAGHHRRHGRHDGKDGRESFMHPGEDGPGSCRHRHAGPCDREPGGHDRFGKGHERMESHPGRDHKHGRPRPIPEEAGPGSRGRGDGPPRKEDGGKDS